MFRTLLKNKLFIIGLLSLVLVFLATFSLSRLTQAQNKAKVVELKDAVERLGPNQIRARANFRLVIDGDGWAVEEVKGKEVRRLEKRIKCGACAGGTCRSRLNGACVPRNSCTSSGCLIDPF